MKIVEMKFNIWIDNSKTWSKIKPLGQRRFCWKTWIMNWLKNNSFMTCWLTDWGILSKSVQILSKKRKNSMTLLMIRTSLKNSWNNSQMWLNYQLLRTGVRLILSIGSRNKSKEKPYLYLMSSRSSREEFQWWRKKSKERRQPYTIWTSRWTY